MESISIIGPGRLGGALAIALSRAGFLVDKLVYRSTEPSAAMVEKIAGRPDLIRFDTLSTLDSDLVLVTTPDTDLDRVAESIAPKLGEGTVLLHTSGALSSEVLRPASSRGIATASMHPLVSVSDAVLGADSFAGAFFCVEGDKAAVTAAERLVRALGGTPFSIETRHKPLYHASAVLASGHLVALFAAAVETLSNCGIDDASARKILLPLVESSVANLSRQSIPAALTGPFARSDLAAVDRHLSAFEQSRLDDEKNIYLALALKALQLAEANGAGREKIQSIRNAVKLAQHPAK